LFHFTYRLPVTGQREIMILSKTIFSPPAYSAYWVICNPVRESVFLSGWRGLWVTQKKGYATTFERYEFITMQFINNHNILQVISP